MNVIEIALVLEGVLHSVLWPIEYKVTVSRQKNDLSV